jgi:hypothetical protein
MHAEGPASGSRRPPPYRQHTAGPSIGRRGVGSVRLRGGYTAAMRWRVIRVATKWALTGATVTLAVLWPISYWRCALWESESQQTIAAIVRGRVGAFHLYRDRILPDAVLHGGFGVCSVADAEYRPKEWLPAWNREQYSLDVVLPLWAAIAAAALPACLLWRSDWRRWASRERGCCAGCGYDRHGLPAGAPCPECGVAFTGGRGDQPDLSAPPPERVTPPSRTSNPHPSSSHPR